MKTVKIILKFKFLTLFSDKIIQCYTESTVYTIITLFLYGIGAMTYFLLYVVISKLHYSYMELELIVDICVLYYYNYIIPIWNWS